MSFLPSPPGRERGRNCWWRNIRSTWLLLYNQGQLVIGVYCNNINMMRSRKQGRWGMWVCSLMWYCICLFVGCKNCASILKMYITLNNRKPEKSARLGPSWRCNCRPVWHTCAANINIHIPTFKLFLKKFNLSGFLYQLLSSHFSLKQCAAETSTLQFLFV